ncbi:MAG: SDR family oxidoreductase [bacterium]
MSNHHRESVRPTALITGASGGIGYELAKLIAVDGHDLVLVSRNENRLKHVAEEFEGEYGTTASVLPMDLAYPHSPDDVFEAVANAGIEIDVLVNNAGFGINGAFHERPLAEQMEMIQLNVTSLVHLTGLFLPGMLERRHGRIMNVSSVAAFQPGPFMAIYYATKAFVLSFSEAIASELRDTGVAVTAVCPGPTTTDFQKRAGNEESKLNRDFMMMDAPTVARIAYDGLKKRKSLVITGARNKLLAVGGRFLPRSLVTNVARSLNEGR